MLRRRLPAGVTALPITARVTPDRHAKAGRGKPAALPPPDPNAIDIDIDVDEQSPRSDMEEDLGDSTNTIVDWVS